MPKTLLQVDSSPRAGSATRLLTAAYVAAWTQANPGGEVRHLDLSTRNVPHLSATEMGAWFADPADHTDLHDLVLARSTDLIADVLAADEIVIGAPMWNFSIPSALKAWLDHVVRNGLTISFGPHGVTGLVPASRAVVISSSGSDYGTGSPMEHLNMVGPYMSQILGFMGIPDVQTIHVNCQGPNWPDAPEILEQARSSVEELALGAPVLT